MVLIKNMEMPEGCIKCRLKDAERKECSVAWKKIPWSVLDSGRRAKWCPLVEVEQYGPAGTLYKEK